MDYTLNTPVYKGPCDSCKAQEYLEKVDTAWFTTGRLEISPTISFQFLCLRCLRPKKKEDVAQFMGKGNRSIAAWNKALIGVEREEEIGGLRSFARGNLC